MQRWANLYEEGCKCPLLMLWTCAPGDRRREWHIRDRIQEAETEPLPANAGERLAFRAVIHN